MYQEHEKTVSPTFMLLEASGNKTNNAKYKVMAKYYLAT